MLGTNLAKEWNGQQDVYTLYEFLRAGILKLVLHPRTNAEAVPQFSIDVQKSFCIEGTETSAWFFHVGVVGDGWGC